MNKATVVYNSEKSYKANYISSGWDYYDLYDNYLVLRKVVEQIIKEEIIILKNVEYVLIEKDNK